MDIYRLLTGLVNFISNLVHLAAGYVIGKNLEKVSQAEAEDRVRESHKDIDSKSDIDNPLQAMRHGVKEPPPNEK